MEVLQHMDATLLIATSAPPRTLPVVHEQAQRPMNPASLALLLSLLIHILAVSLCGMIAISARHESLHAGMPAEPLAVTIVSDLPENCDAPMPALVLEPRPDLAEPAPLETQRITEIEPVQAVVETSEQNGFQDDADGGTLPEVEQAKSGGGGGDDAASSEVGHVRLAREDWSRVIIKTVAAANTIGIGADNSGGAPGTLNTPGSGRGLGNGAGSGALGSSGSGTGSGSGRDGQGSGAGMGTHAPAGITRNAEPIHISGGGYPSDAKRAGHEGLVKVNVEVRADGSVGAVQLALSSGYDELDRAALSAAKDWTFRAALADGRAVDSRVIVPYRYSLQR